MSVLGTKRPLEDPTYSASQRFKENEKAAIPPSTKLGLPEELIAHSLSFLKPQDQATTALVSREFAEITPIAMRSSLYNKYDTLLQWLSPLTELLPEAERNELPVFEPFSFSTKIGPTLRSNKQLSAPFKIIKERRKNYEKDLTSSIATLLHKSLGLPLQEMAPIAIELLSHCDCKEAFSIFLYNNIFKNQKYNSQLYGTEAHLDNLLTVIPKITTHHHITQDWILETICHSYYNLGNFTKALMVIKDTGMISLSLTQLILEAYGDLPSALAIFKQTPNTYKRCQQMGLVCELYDKRGDLVSAISVAQQLPVCNIYSTNSQGITYDHLEYTTRRLFKDYITRYNPEKAWSLAKTIPQHPLGHSSIYSDLQSALLSELSSHYERSSNPQQSLEVAQEISDSRERKKRMIAIANTCLEKNDLKTASSAINQISNSWDSDQQQLSKKIMAPYLENNDLPHALEAIQHLSDDLRQELLHEIGSRSVDIGDINTAIIVDKEINNRAYGGEHYLRNICQKLLVNDDLEHAFPAAKSLISSKSYYLHQISRAYEERGDLYTALRVAEELDDPQENISRRDALEAKLFPPQNKKNNGCVVS